MKLVIFGLSVSSSWGNGHATLWRGLCRALVQRGHRVVFFERDVPYYAEHRDLADLPGGQLVLYPDWAAVLPLARRHLADADIGMVTSYCPDGVAASELVLSSPAQVRTFYDLDSGVTLKRVRSGEPVAYLGPRGLQDFDLVLSYNGGQALTELQARLGARRVAPLYGSVDPSVHQPVAPLPEYLADLSYLGTYADDRQQALEALFIEPARQMPERRFVMGGAQYPAAFPWAPNIYFKQHLPPSQHPAFYCSSLFTLNVTRQAMAEMGYCPSARLFEAAACGTPIVSDTWEGLGHFFAPGQEIVTVQTTADVIEALQMPDAERQRVARAARERVLADHTAVRRAEDLEQAVEAAWHARAAAYVPAERQVVSQEQ